MICRILRQILRSWRVKEHTLPRAVVINRYCLCINNGLLLSLFQHSFLNFVVIRLKQKPKEEEEVKSAYKSFFPDLNADVRTLYQCVR